MLENRSFELFTLSLTSQNIFKRYQRQRKKIGDSG
jgi:hypothetical protein